MPLLTCRDLTVGYDGKAVTPPLSFSVGAGDYLCIIGENGSGKSTLLKALLGLISPLGGEIEYLPSLHKNQLGYLPQQTLVARDFPASTQEIVRSGLLGRCGLRPFYTKQEKARAQWAMEQLDISHLAKSCYRELSGGQQQRVLLARALCAAKNLLLLDEPAASLDTRTTAQLYDIIARLNREQGLAIIMISHDLSAARQYATHILKLGLERGKQHE